MEIQSMCHLLQLLVWVWILLILLFFQNLNASFLHAKNIALIYSCVNHVAALNQEQEQKKVLKVLKNFPMFHWNWWDHDNDRGVGICINELFNDRSFFSVLLSKFVLHILSWQLTEVLLWFIQTIQQVLDYASKNNLYDPTIQVTNRPLRAMMLFMLSLGRTGQVQMWSRIMKTWQNMSFPWIRLVCDRVHYTMNRGF